MKKAVIIHGYEGSPKDCWLPWLADKLKKEGFDVEVPSMPNPNGPHIEAWVGTIDLLLSKPGKDTFLIGHSLGCITALRYVQSLSPKSRIGGMVLVGGFIESINISQIDEFTQESLNLKKIKSICPKITMITSDNDEEIPLEQSRNMASKLGAKLIVEKGKGHFDDYAKVFELPSALNAIKGD